MEDNKKKTNNHFFVVVREVKNQNKISKFIKNKNFRNQKIKEEEINSSKK